MKALFIIFMTVWVLFACNNQQSNQQQFVSDTLTNREFFKQIDTLNKETSKQISDSLIYMDKNIVNHRFFRINIDKKGDTILFDPCYASIATILMQKKRFIHGYGQETNDLQIISSKKDNEKVIYTVKFDGDTDEKYFEKVSFEKLDNKNKYWRIGYKSYDKDAFEYEIFIDSLYKKTIPYKKEPCPEEYD